MSLRFCIDRYEYPNVEGMLPAVMITFNQAQSGCEEEGKRLCTETEWAFACEGPRGLAYSRGDARDDSACNVGHAIENARPEALWEASGVAAVVERLDARTRSGAMRDCASAFGARDLIGNVEEWVKSDTPGFEGALRGGEYSAEPTCRTTRQIRQAGFRQLHTGFRCCEDPLVRAARRRR
jgi:formylglycine-generating enzyme required for sulfatase activity